MTLGGGFKVFRDAVHNMISLSRDGHEARGIAFGDGMLLDLIDTPEMQRLRRIRQLGLASRIYASGEHSRFSHSLGAMHLARRILDALLAHQEELLSREELLAVKVAALLHDLGHGPFSHVFEHIFHVLGSHEEWGRRIVSGESGVHRVIRRHCPGLGLDADAFMATLLAFLGEGKGPPGLGRQLISSQLDADRLDYLLRDAHFTGVGYGRFDLDWLIHSLRAREVHGAVRLCVDVSKGAAALESYVSARDDMYRQVYDHKTVRAFEIHLLHLFRTAQALWALEKSLPPGTPEPLLQFLQAANDGDKPPDLAVFLALDDALLEYALQLWSQPVAKTPLALELAYKCRLLRERGGVYRRLKWWIHGDGPRDVLDDPALCEEVGRFFQDLEEEEVEVAGVGPVPWRLLCRVDRVDRAPYAHLQYAPGQGDPIWVVEASGRIRTAEEASPRIHFLGGIRQRLMRVFVDPRVEQELIRRVAKDFCHPMLRVEPFSGP